MPYDYNDSKCIVGFSQANQSITVNVATDLYVNCTLQVFCSDERLNKSIDIKMIVASDMNGYYECANYPKTITPTNNVQEFVIQLPSDVFQEGDEFYIVVEQDGYQCRIPSESSWCHCTVKWEW